MRTSCTEVYVHYVWATWDRLPILAPELRDGVYAAIAHEAASVHCSVLRAGGTDDHVHVLARVHPAVSVAELAKRMKGGSSHMVTHRLAVGRLFRWQATYGAFSVASDGLAAVMAYIDNQTARHGSSATRVDWERCMIDEG